MQLSEVARLRAIYLTATMAIAAVGIISMQSGGVHGLLTRFCAMLGADPASLTRWTLSHCGTN
eukprot:1404687-Rhodomonas_salina.5